MAFSRGPCGRPRFFGFWFCFLSLIVGRRAGLRSFKEESCRMKNIYVAVQGVYGSAFLTVLAAFLRCVDLWQDFFTIRKSCGSVARI